MSKKGFHHFAIDFGGSNCFADFIQGCVRLILILVVIINIGKNFSSKTGRFLDIFHRELNF